MLIAIWLLVQSIIGILGFYTTTNSTPPRFQLLLLPPLVLIGIQFATRRGKAFIDTLDLKFLTLIHTIRVPVEIVLYWLYLGKAIPELMTFEGRNFDIVVGITAPVVYYIIFIKRRWYRPLLTIWNLLGLVLLANIVFSAIFSVPTSFQKFGFEQPNIAILYFPFNLLPACIVPIVLFSHLASIRRLRLNTSINS